MKVLSYRRVSTAGQADDGYGLDVQTADVARWAKRTGHRIVGTYTDAVSGASEVADRPGLGDALADLRAGPAAGLVVPRLDRLARDLITQEQLIAEVRRAGAVLYTASDAESHFLADDPADPSRRLIRQVLGAVNEYERAMIRLRLASGRRRKHETGGYAYGGVPYGYRVEARELVPDDVERATITRIRELAQAGASLRAIATALEADGLRTRRGGRWHPTVLARILGRDTAA